jgi:ferric-dicitrate binding protein FerR (iron transport regulator)
MLSEWEEWSSDPLNRMAFGNISLVSNALNEGQIRKRLLHSVRKKRPRPRRSRLFRVWSRVLSSVLAFAFTSHNGGGAKLVPRLLFQELSFQRVAEIRRGEVLFSQALDGGVSIEDVMQGDVHDIDGASDATPGSMADPRVVIIAAGESVSIQQGHLSVREANSESLRCELAWRTGKICANGQSIAEVVRKFNRYNHTKIVIADAAIDRIRIGGLFDATDPYSFASAVSALARIRVVIRSTAGAREIRLESGQKGKQ